MHVNLPTTKDLSASGDLFLDEKKEPVLNGVKTINVSFFTKSSA